MIETMAFTLGIATSRSAPSQVVFASSVASNTESMSCSDAGAVFPTIETENDDASFARAVRGSQFAALARSLESENVAE